MMKSDAALLSFAIVLLLIASCKHTENSSKTALVPSILLRESTVAEVNGLRVGCGSVFQGADEKKIRATLIVMDTEGESNESSERVSEGDRIRIGHVFFVVHSISEGKGRAYGSVILKKINESNE